ncbi:MAG: phosphodiester glycosidase family protein [Gemmatimonadetes bacterium]|nr:phosphodiester glycosidase family protein [Gemmatimonadota bacterium]
MIGRAAPLGWALALVTVAAGRAAVRQEPAAATLPPSSLSVRVGREWHTWWSAARAPARWTAGHPALRRAVVWESLRPGLERGELLLAGDAVAARFRVLLVRLDPARYRLRLRQATRDFGLRGAWNLDSASADAVLAFNAGQFAGGDPWGWLVREGRELQPPGTGPLSTAVVLEGDAGPAFVAAGDLPELRRRGGCAEAFQSYPTLLDGDGTVPIQLQTADRGVDVEHRDARLALCLQRDGRLLVALTRYAAMGNVLQNLPVGPTTPEMAALMGGLDCRRAVMLDGGLSSQLLLRDADGMAELWPGLRRVPLALEAVPRN